MRVFLERARVLKRLLEIAAAAHRAWTEAATAAAV